MNKMELPNKMKAWIENVLECGKPRTVTSFIG